MDPHNDFDKHDHSTSGDNFPDAVMRAGYQAQADALAPAEPDETARLQQVRKIHIAVNVVVRREGGIVPACDGEGCSVCAVLLAALAAQDRRERDSELAAEWRKRAYEMREEAGRIRRTVVHATDAEERCYVRAEILDRCAGQLTAPSVPPHLRGASR